MYLEMKYVCFIILIIPSSVVCNICTSKITCSECIRTKGCVWCSLQFDRWNESLPRCIKYKDVSDNWCIDSIINPISSVYIDKNDIINTNNQIHIQPQNLSISLRLGVEKIISLTYTQTKNYPIDIYYLASLSFLTNRDHLLNITENLLQDLSSISNNVRFGFGTFSIKPQIPFISYYTRSCDKNMCLLKPYSFKNHLSLTDKIEQFATLMKNISLSFNTSIPSEGGLDALMQVITCKNHIGWRENAKKILIFSTNTISLISGDGKLGGIVEPNDEKCHTDNSGYNNWMKYDFPSVTQINKQTQKNKINILFTVTKNVTYFYKQLKDHIYGAAIQYITDDSSNLIKLITQGYEAITNSIILRDNADNHIQIKYYTKCTGSREKETNICINDNNLAEINFSVNIKALYCPENSSLWNQTINIKPGISNESTTILLNIHCQCPCEYQIAAEPSIICNNMGKLECGICSCNNHRSGKTCECNANNSEMLIQDINKCKAKDDTSELCSGLGDCKCGKCECISRKNQNERIYGQFCECDNFSCKRHKGLLCSGDENGYCDCGNCICKSGWSGDACECRETNSTCITPNTDKVCSGNGKCICGICQCEIIEESDNLKYSGKFCQECPTCLEDRCVEFKDCIECQVHETGIYTLSECELNCTQYQTEIVDILDNIEKNEQLCRVAVNSDCNIIFKYSYINNEKIKIISQKTKECAIIINVLAVLCIIVGTIVFAGIIMLLIWKVATDIHDRREFAKFERERLLAKFDRGDNPLYTPCNILFRNPTYGLQEH